MFSFWAIMKNIAINILLSFLNVHIHALHFDITMESWGDDEIKSVPNKLDGFVYFQQQHMEFLFALHFCQYLTVRTLKNVPILVHMEICLIVILICITVIE